MSSTEDRIVEAAVQHDALVAGAARDLVADVILKISDILEHGTPERQMTILRAFATPLLRTANQQAENDEMAELRRMVMDLQQRVLGGEVEESGMDEETVDLGGMAGYDTAMDEPPIPT